MPTSAAVATGTLPQANSGTVDLTSAGLGTVSAAIIFITNANSTNNPENDLDFAVGFWDGTTVKSMSNWSDDAVATSDAERRADDNELSFESQTKYTVSNITDGIQLTKQFGTETTDKYVSAILISGATNASLNEHSVGFTTSPTTLTTGHPNHAVFVMGFGSTSGTSNEARFSLGCAHWDGTTVSQGSIISQSQNGQSTANTNSSVSATNVIGELDPSSILYQIAVGNFTSTSFDFTSTANAGNDTLYVLSLELPDADDFYVGVIDAATSTGNDATTGVGFQPDVVGLISEKSTSLNAVASGRTHSFGASDGTVSFCHFAHDQDNVSTTNANSEYSATNVLHVTDDAGLDDYIASLSSLDSDGFTLNYSDAAAGASKIIAFAFGDSATAPATTVTIDQSTVYPGDTISGSYSGFTAGTPPTSPLSLSDGTSSINVAVTVTDGGDGTGTFTGTMPSLPTAGNSGTFILFGSVTATLDDA